MHFDCETNACETPKQCHILTPFQRKCLQKSLQENLPELYRLRIEIMLLADEGKTQTQICKALGCSQGMVRHWTLVARSGQAHNWQDIQIGRPKSLNDAHIERLKKLVSHNPKEFGYSFQRWTGKWLSKHLAKEFGIEVSDRHINRLLKQLGLSTRSKPVNTEDIQHQNDTSTFKIAIGDLTSTTLPESTLPIYPLQFIH
ncbi:MAG: helix-turn-helix domain-containing protein [Microcoleus sp. SU_5_3]|nr:helix-turn-helix domain-containing protein [Microcoleus sp. SU_5_3]